MYAEIIVANALENPWYWVLVFFVWDRSFNKTIGIPNSLMRPAMNGDVRAKQDALACKDIHIRSMMRIFTNHGRYTVALVCFILASVTTLGFWYELAFLQGVFFILMPMLILGWIALSLALRLHVHPVKWEELCRIYRRHRWFKFGLATLFIFMTNAWAWFVEIRPYLEPL